MSTHSWGEIEAIIDEVLDLPEEQRRSFIEENYGNQDELKKQIYELLQSITESEGWLEDKSGTH
jgi:dephospho-CoA kinase